MRNQLTIAYRRIAIGSLILLWTMSIDVVFDIALFAWRSVQHVTSPMESFVARWLPRACLTVDSVTAITAAICVWCITTSQITDAKRSARWAARIGAAAFAACTLAWWHWYLISTPWSSFWLELLQSLALFIMLCGLVVFVGEWRMILSGNLVRRVQVAGLIAVFAIVCLLLAWYGESFVLPRSMMGAPRRSITWLSHDVLIAMGVIVVWRLHAVAKRVHHGFCPNCSYDLQGKLDLGCSECGWSRA